MKITIDTNILQKYNYTLEEFLIMLIGYYDVNYEELFLRLGGEKIIEPDLYSPMSIVLSDNTRKIVDKILVESDSKAQQSSIDFNSLAEKLQGIYPKGLKPGTTYSWRGNTSEIAHLLRLLIVKYDFNFTEQEAVEAVKEYIDSFKDYKYTQLLKNMILKVTDYGDGNKEINSLFMTIIENNRRDEA